MSNTVTSKGIISATVFGWFLLAACGAESPLDPEALVSRIMIHSGDDQVGPAGSKLPLPLAVQVTDSGDRGVPDVRIHWQLTSGTGELRSWPEDLPLTQPFTVSDRYGVARVLFRPTEPGTSTVAAWVAGLEGSPAIFAINAILPADVVIRFGAIFDCYGSPSTMDPSRFLGPDGSSDVTVEVGATVDWIYGEWMGPGCRAQVVSTSVPAGGEPIDSGIIRPGQHFRFVPDVAGTWEFTDAINGGSGTLTAW